MKNKRYRNILIIGLVVAFTGLGAVLATGTHPRLGLDLEGGISVILTAEGQEVQPDVLQETVNLIRARIDALGVAEPEVSVAGSKNILIQLPGLKDTDQALKIIGTTAQLTFRQVIEQIPAQTTGKDKPKVTKEKGDAANDQEVIYPSGQVGEEGILYRLEPARLTGEVVTKAEAVVDPQSGRWSVSIKMDKDGSREWAKFTSELACLRDKGDQLKSQVAIVLDGKVESAAGMAEANGADQGVVCGTGITGGDTQINVGGEQEAKDLALVLKTGALPITLVQSEVNKVSPTLGRDSLDTGLLAGAVGLAIVMLYVLLYYRTLGLVIWLGFAQFTAFLYTALAVLGQTAGLSLTLAGVAGIIVSIGIAADSFIVAFERLKDEVRSGKSLRSAVERGSARAIKTILVADFVTGAAAVILFFLAVGPVRGFALTLGLSTAIDILLAYILIRPAMVLLGRTKYLHGAAVGIETPANPEPGVA
ncbi:MAG: preprotein translocase subunit SecD [Actinomycetota bacterium]|jgi:protein-export membrane protein SecD|nr:preprotein translocase subunit SecD [Actinomycetota bacterium]